MDPSSKLRFLLATVKIEPSRDAMDRKLPDELLESELTPAGPDSSATGCIGCFPLAFWQAGADCASGRAGSECRISSKTQGGLDPSRYGINPGESGAEIAKSSSGHGKGLGKSSEIAARVSANSSGFLRRSLLGRFLLDPATVDPLY